MSPSISSALSNRAKQKTIPAVVIDVLGNRCSVRLSGRGTKLTGLEFVGSVPKIGDAVIVDYRNANTPMVLTSGSVEVAAPQPVTAAVVTGTAMTPTEPTGGGTQDWPPVDGQQYVAKDGDWVVLEDVDIEWPPSDGEQYAAQDGKWEQLVLPDFPTLDSSRIAVTDANGALTTLQEFHLDPDSHALILGADGRNPYSSSNGSIHQMSDNAVWNMLYTFNDNNPNLIKAIRSRGSKENPAPLLSNDEILRIQAAGAVDGEDIGNVSSAKIVFIADENFGPGHRGARIDIYTTPNGTTGMVKALTINSDGTLNIAEGKTYNVGGVPHTHTGLQPDFVINVYEDLSNQINPGSSHFSLSAMAEVITVTVNGLSQRISEIVLDADCKGFHFEAGDLIPGDELVVRYGTSISNVFTDDDGHVLFDDIGNILFVDSATTTFVDPLSVMDDGGNVLTDDGLNVLFFDSAVSLLALTDDGNNLLYDDANNLLFA